ncbi:MAG: acetyl-CoA carboxylase biotin carboxyl carrier protein [Janthinobacterium lividum]
MGEGDLQELRDLVEFLKASGVTQFDMERPELKVRLKFAGHESNAVSSGGIDLASLARLLNAGPALAASAASGETEPGVMASAPVSTTPPSAEAVDENAGLHIVKSPLVGTFYAAPAPGADTFVKIGDTVGTGKVLCIVEAMKIMNEIESDAAGEIVKVFVKPGQPVEYGQQLFALRS